MAVKPPVQWAQRKAQIFLHVDVSDLKDVKIELDEEKNKLTFAGKASGKEYAFDIEFFDGVQKEGSVNAIHGNGADMLIMKKESKEHWPRLTKEKAKLNWLAVDWKKFVDEDDETPAKSSFDMSGFDPSQMGDFMQNYGGGGGMGGMPGMGGMGGMPGMEGMDFSSLGGEGGDDDDEDDGDMEAAD